MMLFIRNFLIAFFGFFLLSVGVLAIPFIGDLPQPTKFRVSFAFASICLASIAAYDALSHVGNTPWTDKALAIANVICAFLGAYLASTLTSIFYLLLHDIPPIGGLFRPPTQWIAAAAAEASKFFERLTSELSTPSAQ
jgi:hypothetical protein